jgi:general secretion pathway protein N
MTQSSKWSITGALIGACFALVTQAPASWLANAISNASQHRFVLQNAQGTVWRGSAIALLADGNQTPTVMRQSPSQLTLQANQSDKPSSNTSSISPNTFGMPLPSRLSWDFSSGFDKSLMRLVMRAQIKSECCTPEPLHLAASIGLQGLRINIANQQSQWPAHWLVGLGAPWNTVQPEGSMQLRTENLIWQSNAGDPKIQGVAELTLSQLATPLSTLRPLGTYRLRVQGGDTMAVSLATIEGGLQLSGNGQWANGRLRFKGEARAQPAFEAALSNLLNILGQRQGAISIMELG